MHSYNQYKQKIKHNKIQLEQELWSPAYVNNGKLPHKKVGTKVIHKWTSIQKNEWPKNCKKPKYHEYAKVKKAINTYLGHVQYFNKIITTHSQVETIKLDKSPQYPQAI